MFVAANGKVIYPSNISRYENCALFSFDDADTPMILYLKGDSYSRGYAYGKLLGKRILRMLAVSGTQLFAMNGGWQPDGQTCPTLMQLEAGKVAVKERVLKNLIPAIKHFSPETLIELQGLFDSLKEQDESVSIDELYMLNFSPESVEDPSGCSNFAAWGTATLSGELIHAINMDYSTLGLLHENTIICAVEPDSGLSYLAITFVGSILPTTFLNNKGLSYGEMTSNSTARNWPAIPHYVQAMLMATTCETCEEAYQLVRNTGGTTGFNLMVCQTEGDEVGVVIETAGALVNIRGAEDEDQQLIYSTNFFHTHPQDGSADLISGQIDYWSKDVDMIKRRFQRDTITFEDADSLEKWKELVICPRDQFYRVELKKLYGTLDAITAIKLQSTPPLAVYGDQQSPEYTLCEALDMPYGITEPLKNRWGLRSLYSVVFIPREKNMYVAAGMQPAQAGRFLKINFETIAKAAALV